MSVVDKDSVLYALAVEPTHDKATLERYLRDYPELAEDLIDLCSELRLGKLLTGSPVPRCTIDDPEAEAAWQQFLAVKPKDSI